MQNLLFWIQSSSQADPESSAALVSKPMQLSTLRKRLRERRELPSLSCWTSGRATGSKLGELAVD